MTNPILDELYAARHKLLTDAGGDLHRYVEGARQRALASRRKLERGVGMQIRALSRHNSEFDILTHPVYPAKSPYARISNYTQRIAEFYNRLGIESALWAHPEDRPPRFVERCKPCEYVLQLDVSRIVAYINEATWSPYLYGDRDDFEYSTTPTAYPELSLLIPTPIRLHEVLMFRRYRNTNGPESFEIVEERHFGSNSSP